MELSDNMDTAAASFDAFQSTQQVHKRMAIENNGCCAQDFSRGLRLLGRFHGLHGLIQRTQSSQGV